MCAHHIHTLEDAVFLGVREGQINGRDRLSHRERFEKKMHTPDAAVGDCLLRCYGSVMQLISGVLD